MKIINNNKKIIACASFYIDDTTTNVTKDKLISKLVKNLPVSSVGYAGFRKKEYLKKHLHWQIFDATEEIKRPFKLNKRETFNIIKKAINRCHRVIPSDPTRIFIFPTFNPFVIKKMSGVAGYCPWKDTIHIYIYPASGWKKALENTIYHEFNHSVVTKYHKRKTLLDNIIFEGLAENFGKSLLKINTPWAKAISLAKCKKIFPRIKKLLKSEEYNIYHELFFAGKKYPLWTGYSIGYQIVKNFIKNNKKLTWKEVIKIKPETIFKKSLFFYSLRDMEIQEK